MITIDLYFDENEPINIPVPVKKKAVKRKVKEEVSGEVINPKSTYILLPDDTYYEILRKDAIRLSDEELTAYVFRRWGLKFARDMKIFRGKGI